MKQNFKAKKDISIGIVLMVISGIIFALTFSLPLIEGLGLNIPDFLIPATLAGLTIILFLWIWTTTSYASDDTNLYIKSGWFNWKLQIKKIKKIELNKKSVSHVTKPTLSWQCIVIHYDNLEIAITPIEQDRFVEMLKGINKNIVIK